MRDSSPGFEESQKLQEYINELAPVVGPQKSSILQWNTSLQSISLQLDKSDKALFYKSRQISCITMLATFARPELSLNEQAWRAARVVLTVEGGSRLICQFKSMHFVELQAISYCLYRTLSLDKRSCMEMCFTLPDCDIEDDCVAVDKSFMSSIRDYPVSKIPIRPDAWRASLQRDVYSNKTQRFYNRYRLPFLSRLKEYVGDGKVDVVLSIGCGEGDCLCAANAVFSPKQLQGLDPNQKNLDILSERFNFANLSNTTVTTYKGHHGQLLELFKKPKKSDQVLGIAIGCFTRKVQSGTLSALRGLQQAFRVCRHFGVMGGESVLYSREILRKLGWDFVHESYLCGEGVNDKRNRFFMRRPSAEFMHAYLQSRIIDGYLLDLSLNAAPRAFLSCANHLVSDSLSSIEVVNLRFAFFKDQDEFENFMISLLKFCPKLRHLIVEDDDACHPWAKELKEVKLFVKSRPSPRHELPMLENLVSTEIFSAIESAERKRLAQSNMFMVHHDGSNASNYEDGPRPIQSC